MSALSSCFAAQFGCGFKFDFFHQSKVTVKNMPNDCDAVACQALRCCAIDIYVSAMKMF